MDRIILHSDLNSFYASVECFYHPELKDKPVVVGGDEEARHGIVLAKNNIAKPYGIITGEPLYKARQKCPNLIVMKPNFQRYLKFSKMARAIYKDYTNLIEPFGIDEAWLDVTDSTNILGKGEDIAHNIRERIKSELGITVSIGVSWNKVFAKLGSDYKKPDAVTVFTKENYKQIVWALPAADLLYVGRATSQKLQRYGINTIGELATAPTSFLHSIFGKCGDMLHTFANGLDTSPVSALGDEAMIKSIGNSTTSPRDLNSNEDVKIIIYILAESVAERIRHSGFKCSTICISVRDCDLYSFERQCKTQVPTNLASEIAQQAYALFIKSYDWCKPIRSIGVRATGFTSDNEVLQLSLLSDETKRVKNEKIERTVDNLRGRFGHFSVSRGILLQDPKLSGLNPKEDNSFNFLKS